MFIICYKLKFFQKGYFRDNMTKIYATNCNSRTKSIITLMNCAILEIFVENFIHDCLVDELTEYYLHLNQSDLHIKNICITNHDYLIAIF